MAAVCYSVLQCVAVVCCTARHVSNVLQCENVTRSHNIALLWHETQSLTAIIVGFPSGNPVPSGSALHTLECSCVAVCCSALQCVAVCCVAVCCNTCVGPSLALHTLKRFHECCSVLQWFAVCFAMCCAVCCAVCSTECCSVLHLCCSVLQRDAVCPVVCYRVLWSIVVCVYEVL